MKQRCSDPGHIEYHRYGARGIRMCERWRNSFEAFLDDMGLRPKGCSIDRIDVNGNYELSNCRWATPKEQSRNKRNNRIITIGDESKSVVEWSEIENAATASNIYSRLDLGWSGVEAVFGRGASCKT